MISRLSNRAFKQCLESLSHGRVLSFVTDLWAHRGWHPRVHGSVVTVTKTGSSITKRLLVVSDPTTTLKPASTEFSHIDVIVSTSPASRVQTVARQFDARYLGPDELYRMFLYAIDRETADSLFRRYFDRSIPSSGRKSRPLLGRSKDRRSATWNGPKQHSPAVQSGGPEQAVSGSVRRGGWIHAPTSLGPIILVTVIGIILLGSVVSVGTGALSASVDGSGIDRSVEPSSQSRYPDGVGPAGITNLSQLVSSHRSAMDDQTYELHMTHHGSQGLIVTRFRWIESVQQLSVVGPQEFAFVVNGTLAGQSVGDTPAAVSFSEHANGSTCSHHPNRGSQNQGKAELSCLIQDRVDGSQQFAGITGAYLRRYLDTSYSTIRTLKSVPPRRFLIVATGSPAQMYRPTESYRAEAVLTESGAVLELRVNYTLLGVDGRTHVSFEFQFTRFGGVDNTAWE